MDEAGASSGVDSTQSSWQSGSASACRYLGPRSGGSRHMAQLRPPDAKGDK